MTSTPLSIAIFQAIRETLISGKEIPETLDAHDLGVVFQPSLSQLRITLLEAGQPRLRSGGRRATFPATLQAVCKRLRQRPRFSEFDPSDPMRCRILLEIVVQEREADLAKMAETETFGPHRYEPGITGLKASLEGKSHYYLPTDAVFLGHRNLKSTLRSIARALKLTGETLAEHPIDFHLVESRAFVTYEQNVLFLYRGLPPPPPLNRETLERLLDASGRWMRDHMREDGRFLYYYNLANDSEKDHFHPKNPSYYNIVRHSGGVFGLLRFYEWCEDPSYLEAAKNALIFVEEQCRSHDTPWGEGRYVFYNRKGKLGGTGLALTALALYRKLSKDTRFDELMTGMARHIISRILPDGEMIGFFIHPRFHGGGPIENPTRKEQAKLFSFYYPGEALLGLAFFVQEGFADPELAATIREKARLTLDFIIKIRPKRYPELYSSLPSDAWLMQAIEAWHDDPEMRNKAWNRFVYSDAQKMIDHMYQPGETPYPDYAGTFRTHFGAIGNHQGNRGEGLVAAYHLAKKTGERRQANKFHKALMLLASSLPQTSVTPESCYPYPNPEKCIGSIRFKSNQKWVQVDSAQHTACFYARLLPLLKK
ncbi:MAG: protein containing Six-hairpin glycosidase-like domain protein [Magnetococcales bacterium]|nr:protein containing Six-hairpin glycosidase-like domain protein [Magnetococcales bacterium]